jgi:hypothetical protein
VVGSLAAEFREVAALAKSGFIARELAHVTRAVVLRITEIGAYAPDSVRRRVFDKSSQVGRDVDGLLMA